MSSGKVDLTMKQFTDANGLVVTATVAESADRFADLTSAYMGFRRDTGDILRTLLETDPDMPMAQCTKGYFAKLMGGTKQASRARSIADRLEEQLAGIRATDRERQHAGALAAWARGDTHEATRLWENILLEHPLDGLALRLAHFTHFYSGDGRRMRDSLASVLPLWPGDHTDYGYVLGMYAFGLEESREYKKAEDFGRRAVALNPSDAWSVHAVAH